MLNESRSSAKSDTELNVVYSLFTSLLGYEFVVYLGLPLSQSHYVHATCDPKCILQSYAAFTLILKLYLKAS